MIKNITIALFLASSSAVTLDKFDPAHGAPIPICNGANEGSCTEANDVVVHRIRRAYKRAAPGDPDFEAQEKADQERMKQAGVLPNSLT